MQFTALTYGPNLPATGSKLSARLDGFQLTVTLPEGRTLAVPLSQVQLSAGGFNNTVWRFEWRDAQGRWAAMLDDLATQQTLFAQPPAGLSAALIALGKNQRGTRIKQGLGFGAIVLWSLLPLLLIALLLWNASALTRWVAGHIPVSVESKIGEAVWQAQKVQLRLVQNTVANQAVEFIGAKLTEGSGYKYRWFVARDNSINAFAIPGGTVVIHTALIEAAKTPEELAGVLAHEVQHVEQRHSLRAMTQSLGTVAALGLLLGDVSGPAQIAASLSQLSYSRDVEREADQQGLLALKAAGIAPEGMLNMFETLSKNAEGLQPPALLSSHPAGAERLKSLRIQLAQLGSWQSAPMALDWNAVRDSLH